MMKSRCTELLSQATIAEPKPVSFVNDLSNGMVQSPLKYNALINTEAKFCRSFLVNGDSLMSALVLFEIHSSICSLAALASVNANDSAR